MVRQRLLMKLPVPGFGKYSFLGLWFTDFYSFFRTKINWGFGFRIESGGNSNHLNF